MNMTMTSKVEYHSSTEKTSNVTVIITGGWNVPTIQGKITMWSTIKSIIEQFSKTHQGYVNSYGSIVNKLMDGVYIITREPHRDSERIDLDARLDEIFDISSIKSDKQIFELYMWDFPVNPCNRCGICCMFGFHRNHDAYGTPISKDTWVGQGINRCVNLQFDAINGVYGCAMVNERSRTCERFFCEYLHGEKHETQSLFGKNPEHPRCSEHHCFQIREVHHQSCRHCEILPARAEWFIAFARRRKLSSANLALASELRSELASSTIDQSFKELLMKTIDEIIVTRARKNSTVKQT